MGEENGEVKHDRTIRENGGGRGCILHFKLLHCESCDPFLSKAFYAQYHLASGVSGD